ncbi:hypothetical protein EJB05_22106, partial [Eragrostis curvula]
MSLDGSFSTAAALERLLARCPALRAEPRLLALASAAAPARDDVAAALAEPLLHPRYTIPVLGCFLPLARDLVDRAVALLCAAGPALRADDAARWEEEAGEEDIRVVEFYLSRGRGLRLHEVACLALARALDLAPYLLRSVLSYFKSSPPPFQRLLREGFSLRLPSKELHLLLDAAQVSYRFLGLEPRIFCEQWDWSCFLDLVYSTADCSLVDNSLYSVGLDLRWCTIQILLVVLKASDMAVESFGLGADEAFTCYLRWKEFCMDTSIEKASLYLQNEDRNSKNGVDGFTSLAECLSDWPEVVTGRANSVGSTCPFVLTATLKKSYEVALMAVSQKWPILLYGPVGAGKTALINKLAQIGGNRVLFIHMDEQMDGRTLIGSYVCTEKPGEFKWAPGSLTQAIVKGFWIVFEDIDKAPSDVQSILLPLLEGSSSFSVGHAEVVEVSESFRLFGTITTSKNDVSHALEGRLTFSALWRKVMVGEPNRSDLVNIIKGCYPSLEPISSKLIDTFEKVNSLVSNQFGGLNLAGTLSDGVLHRFSSRDLLKWCKRILGVDLNIEGLGFASSSCKLIYHEVLIQKGPFADIRRALEVLERVACSIKFNEPILLVGETGTGKTTTVQNLAAWLKQPLTVVNLSQQSDISDLLGGFKPTDARSICFPLYMEFKDLFCRSFSGKDNEAILRQFDMFVMQKKWKKLLRALAKCVEKAQKLIEGRSKSCIGSKRKRPLPEQVISDWDTFASRLNAASSQIGSATGMSFRFVEGAFVSALRNGHWILLDEVNLAPPETLQRIGAVLDGERGTLCLAERGDVDYVVRHPCFRMFACMNPATDAGKRELPYTFRSRFTEYFVDDLMDDDDLRLFISKYLDSLNVANGVTDSIVRFYKVAKKESEERLQDGANQKPQFSLRSLSRALGYIKNAEKKFGFRKALYDGFCMFFLTMLDAPSAKIIKNSIVSILLDGRVPPSISFVDYFIEKPMQLDGCESDDFLRSYVLTKSVTEHIVNLARAVYIKRYPVLLQGPTSSGKTSLVRYLAAKTGHEFVRINNHEHTDLQEYLGTYVTDSQGKLQFQEGALVKAVREGHWIVLDELNLAPSDVLEALNRLLDDNRELFVPELQETIPAHPNFMLFATQNPPMLYGGRKMLSRAFRNRFIEVHVDEIPDDELITILEQRCRIAPSYAAKMVQVMKDLQMHRQNSRVFAGKHGFITPRDLFRWANRYRTFEGKSYEDLAKDGYLLLAERLRDDNEKGVVQEALERHLRVKLNVTELYNSEVTRDDNLSLDAIRLRVQECFGNITWTKSMWRLYFLIERCYRSREPVLLVGETGGGKTTVCQVLSAVLGLKLHILNCHQYTETSDFIGGFCPIRDRSRIALEFKHLVARIRQMKIFIHVARDMPLETDISGADSIMGHLNEMLERYRKEKHLFPEVSAQDLDAMEQIKLDLMHLHKRWQAIFLWQDGPLVQAMKSGDLFLIDEISLADDSVLERLNSVLEPERKLSLAEKGGSVLEKIVAHPNFFILATMNPGGDYGKKELSPALRNRFTELWVPAVTDVDELKSITLGRFTKPELSCYGDCIVSFWNWFNQLHIGRMLTIRDLLSWISFIDVTEQKLGRQQALVHGLFLILLDGLSLGVNVSKTDATELRRTCLSFLLEQVQKVEGKTLDSSLNDLSSYGWGDNIRKADMDHDYLEDHFGIAPFYIAKGHFACKQQNFEIMAPTTSKNVMRVLRGMQLPKPILLEGSPGVGKTSLIVALAGFSGHDVVRINLSEQTDMMDLLGSDLPAEGANGMEFSWSDGILLQALKNGSWVLLDELNLAPQSVLEGLNAILDHRAEVFIPELGQTYKCPPSFRIFACQNPSSQGGGRKGLPKSFLNRFTKVYVDELSEEDYLFICKSRFYPLISENLLRNLIRFNNRLYMDTMIHRKYGQEGSPWEFNLRDIIRSCEMIAHSPDISNDDCFLNTVYLQRMRTVGDRHEVVKLFEEVFQKKPSIYQSKMLHVNRHYLTVGSASIVRNNFQSCKAHNNQLNIFPGSLHSLEAMMHCIHQGWLCILVGQNSSGKTSLIRLLAQLSGNTLNELNLSSATDVSELLGCFEQYNFFRHYKAVISQVEHYIDVYFGMSMDMKWKNLILERKGLFAKWFEFMAAKKYSSVKTSTFIEMTRNATVPSLCLVAEIVEQMKCDMEMFDLPISLTKDDMSKTLKSINNLQQNGSAHQPVKFEWVAGDLIKAIEGGEWIVLDNANFCNPTVLDRINSLVEQERSIVVNECGLVDGNPVVLKAHPKFRMFLTVNAKYGEVSRAMRNRGVEVFIMDQHWNMDRSSNVPGGSERKDVIRFLISCGIPILELISSMTEAHMYAKAAGLCLGINITLLEITRWVQLFQQLLIKGNQFLWSLHLSWDTHTCHLWVKETQVFDKFDGSDIVDERKFRFLTDFDGSTGLHSGFSLSLPGGWPVEQKLRDFIWYSKETCIRRNCMYLQSLGAQYAAYQISSLKDSSSSLGPISNIHPAILPTTSLCELQFPTFSGQRVKTLSFDSDLADKMLFFAANWVMEQSTENDLELYATWFKWYNCLVQPYCNFFESYMCILKEEMEHPIWQSILECYREIIAYHKINIVTQDIPLLSKKLLDMAGCVALKACDSRLRNAWSGLNLLRLTLQQWQLETNYPDYAVLKTVLLPALKSLRCLEGEMESVNLSNLQEFNFQYGKPTLWVYGGHPLVPSSGGIFYKFQEILAFSAAVWPRRNLLNSHLDDKQLLTHVMLSANQDLRRLAMEGVSMASLVASKYEEDVSTVASKLEEVHKRLARKVDCEHGNLELLFKTSTTETKLCCSVSSDTLCNSHGFKGWLASLPLLNLKSLNLDTLLLQQLSKCTQKDSSEAHEIIVNSEYLLKYAMDYSLESSSRSPLEYIQHQIIWWIHQAWATVDNVHVKVATAILEMWYNYHSSLWTYCSGSPKGLYSVTHDETCDLAHLTKKDAINTILQQDLCVVDYLKNCLMLKISSRSLWEGVSHVGNLVGNFHSAADSLFKQIIFVHKKHFKTEDYSRLETILFQQTKHYLEKEDLDTVSALLSSSSHGVLASLSGPEKLVEFLLMDLYSPYSRDSLLHTGAAWVHIGELRFRLLLSSYSPDPAFESAYKHSHICEKISLVELEGKVRHDCEELAGFTSAEDSNGQKLLQELRTEEKDLRSKVVFRPQQSKHKSVVAACIEFEDRLSDCKDLLAKLNCKEVGQLEVDRVCNWQITSMNFIKRLTEDYGEYVDLIQPIQVAVYEMKLGLAIALAGSLQREYLKTIKEDDIERVLGTIYAFMQFPSGSVTGRVISDRTDLTNYGTNDQTGQYSKFGDVDILKKLAAVSSQVNVGKVADKVKSHSEMLISIHHISLVRATYGVSCSLILDKATYLSMKDTFDHFTSMWIDMKSRLKAKENEDSQFYRFRSRIIDIEDIFKEDVPSLSDMDTEGSDILDNEEKLEHEFFRITKIDEDVVVAEDTWDAIPESTLKCIVTIHNQLFGSPDLEKPTKCQISDVQKIQSFIESYELGTRILKDLPELTCSILDEKLMPEHLFRDPNPSVLFKMVEPLTALQDKVRFYLDEWPDHPGLLKIFDIIASLLAMPLCTPLSKALLGLQLLAGKAQTLQENDSKFFLKDHLAPIFLLVYSWQRLELDCWPVLLEEVQGKYDENAVKLWFPLRALLTQTSCIPRDEDLSIIKSVEEFVQTSNLGEFKRRLHLLLALHGEISGGASVGSYLSTPMKKIQNILYNVFGYYMQFLSLVLGQIEAVKGSIEKELKDQVKLYRWEQEPCSTASIENFKRTRQKVFKLLRRFNDILQKPVMVLLNEEATRKVPCWLDPQGSESQFPVDIEKFNNRFLWFNKWASQTCLSLQNLQHTAATATGVASLKEYVDVAMHNVNRRQDETELNDRLNFFWVALERICVAANFSSTLKHGKKNQKKAAMSNLFKTLEECGLSKHRPISHEWGDELAATSSLFLENSYDTVHLLQQESSHKTSEDVSIVHSTLLTTDNWKHANQQYFKCLAMMQQLRQVSFKFNKDLGLEEKLFDSVLVMTTDTNLLLKSFKDCHYTLCNNFKEEVASMSSFLGKFISRFAESKDLLDKYLLGSNNILADAHTIMPVATREMEELVAENWQLIDSLREDVRALCDQDISMRSVKKILLSRLDELLEKGKVAIGNSKEIDEDDHRVCSNVLQTLEASYAEILKETFVLAVGVVGKLSELEISSNGDEDSSVGTITSWKDVSQSYAVKLKLDHICDASEKLCTTVRRLVGNKPEMRASIEVHLTHLHAWLGVILSSAEGILSELLEAHRSTSEMTHALGDLLLHLFAEGFGSTEDTTEDSADERQQDATGTGMGDGEGQESVSSKIDDPSQIDGTDNEKEATCKPDQPPENDDNAIEMAEDFTAELSDISEDPEGKESGDEDEDMNLDNQMGDTGDASEVVGKKSWDKDEDDDSKTSTEKYESGSSAKGTEHNDQELRAKEDDSVEDQDPMEMDCDEQGKNSNLEDEPSPCEETDLNTDEIMNRDDAYDDRTGPELPEPENGFDDDDVEGQEQNDEKDADNEEIGSEEAEQPEERPDASDDMEEGDTAQHSDNMVDDEGEHVEDANMEPSDIDKQQIDKTDSLMHPSQSVQPDNVLGSNRESEENLANSSDMNGAVAPSANFSGNEVPNLEISMPNTGDDSRLLSNSKPEMQNDGPQSHIKQTNPFRSIGDAMEEWKERAKVSADTQDHQLENEDHSEDDNATEFRYVPEGEQSTSQALGAATADQTNDDTQIKQSFLEDENNVRNEQTDERSGDDTQPEVPTLQSSQAPNSKSKNDNELEGRELQTDTSVQDFGESRKDNTFGDLVSFLRPPVDDKTTLLDDLTIDHELPTQMDIDINYAQTGSAIVDWKNLELATMKLSQELAEQLRLVMEPTLASKLQGDYRTGKRINMKKVIPYIASHFRRDKIWLRRTKPNKRNYQVVIAVDDSRSMSEGKCGKVAIEALVTVCRAMSQLEVGQFAVASFGKKGNVSVLHDFDQIFNGEAGVNMISSLSFEQDNKIEDQPVADLLTHLNAMLDTAVTRARTPSGQNPLQQLILIISDGKFHEKENLKRHVRDVLNRKRMVAYVLLDNPEDSIMNLKQVSFEKGGGVNLEKYMDSFPFPYYVMLNNIEALPRTLADLLRQWFELMQSANE